jgi:hypothetical protein
MFATPVAFEVLISASAIVTGRVALSLHGARFRSARVVTESSLLKCHPLDAASPA